jgi:hypothetical protein
MLKNVKRIFFAAAIVLSCFSNANAFEDGQNVIYIGSGTAINSPDYAEKPKTLGFIRLSSSTPLVWGLDVSYEGIVLDATKGRRASQAESFNILLGRNIHTAEHFRLEAAFIAGIREKTIRCPSGTSGYQCDPNVAPDTDFAFNGGVAVIWSYKNLMLGARWTEKSRQALLGVKF